MRPDPFGHDLTWPDLTTLWLLQARRKQWPREQRFGFFVRRWGPSGGDPWGPDAPRRKSVCRYTQPLLLIFCGGLRLLPVLPTVERRRAAAPLWLLLQLDATERALREILFRVVGGRSKTEFFGGRRSQLYSTSSLSGGVVRNQKET